jgi:hypothetical protein
MVVGEGNSFQAAVHARDKITAGVIATEHKLERGQLVHASRATLFSIS